MLQLYINDEFFDTPTPENAFLSVFKPQLDIVYEDENLLLVNKRPGLVVHPDEQEKVNTLLTHIQAYLYQKKEWDPRQENAFAPALCNRIDRNTGGIVIAAKNAETLRVMNQKILGPGGGEVLPVHHLRGHHPGGQAGGATCSRTRPKAGLRPQNLVPGGRTAVTLYQTLAQKNGLSLVACRLVTGRTHQIRAQFVAAGHPLLGMEIRPGPENKKYGRTGARPAPTSWPSASTTDAGCLAGLNGRVWTVDQVDFVTDLFPTSPCTRDRRGIFLDEKFFSLTGIFQAKIRPYLKLENQVLSLSKARHDRHRASRPVAKATRTAGSNAEFRMMRRQLLLPY